ncbi:DUF1804 family protein [Tenacibaculum maritimum]|uniref:DUF1804 family protein n=1 Tax=Tenacibaculum maritimum TaxID=107401 RepID=UPI00040ABFA5|nr:hypothetical protein [Tenacibaculum maritimum]CAA0260287.1 conserved hypothetical protein [Tenacibaculum maritimum]
MARRTKQEILRLQEWAKTEYLKNGLTYIEIAKKVGVTAKTIGIWAKEQKWENLKAATIISKPEQLSMIYAQINELNSFIRDKEEGQRFANSKEADALKKLTAAAKDLEGELGLSQIVNVAIPLLQFVKKTDYDTAMKLQTYIDEFIRTVING